MEFLKKLERLTDKKMSKYPIFTAIEVKTGVKKTHLIFFLFIGLKIFFLLTMAKVLFIDVFSFFYPFISSMKLLEIPSNETTSGIKKEEVTKWISYWIILFMLSSFEKMFQITSVPFYYFLKFAFILWLYFPKTQGSLVFYYRVLFMLNKKMTSVFHNIMKVFEKKIDSMSETEEKNNFKSN